MNLFATIEIYGGGVGSGCRGSNCGRKSSGNTQIPNSTVKSPSEPVDVFYHGTVLPSAKQMLKEGLAPKPENAFQTGNIPSSKNGYVYVTRNKRLAMLFANARASYDAASPGTHYTFQNPYIPGNPRDHLTTMYKRFEAQPSVDKQEVPAVVELDIPKSVVNQFKKDPDWHTGAKSDEGVNIHQGIIPKEFIKNVSVRQGQVWKDYKPSELAASKSGTTLYLVYYGPLDALKRHLNAGA